MDQLSHHPYLDSINLVIDPVLKALCCTLCMVAIQPTHVKSHLQDNHKNLTYNSTHLLAILKANGISLELPNTSQFHNINPFKGLKIFNGFKCSFCSQVTSSTKYLHAHHISAHPDLACPST